MSCQKCMRWQCECGEYEEETEPRGLEESDLLGSSPNEQLIESLRTQLAKAKAEKAELVRQCAEIAKSYMENSDFDKELETEMLSILPKE